MDERVFLDLIIALLPGLAPKDRICLSEEFSREEDLIKKSKGDIEKILGHTLKLFWDIDTIRAMAQRDAAVCEMRSIYLVSWTQADYPPLLREMYDPPVILFYRGQLPNPEKPLLGMVGTRKPSPEAALQAFTVARDLGRQGISVVSGLALGIDTMSHKGNLEGGAPTFAVLGSGADEIYPSTNRPLAKRILETGGALLSEYPPGTGPYKWNFPVRNRIISALARSVLIVEAPQRSGALITARLALDQGKELWAASSGIAGREDAPGRNNFRALFDKRGTTKLAEDGADIIYSASDILEKWGMEIAGSSRFFEIPAGNSGGRALAESMAKRLKIEM